MTCVASSRFASVFAQTLSKSSRRDEKKKIASTTRVCLQTKIQTVWDLHQHAHDVRRSGGQHHGGGNKAEIHAGRLPSVLGGNRRPEQKSAPLWPALCCVSVAWVMRHVGPFCRTLRSSHHPPQAAVHWAARPYSALGGTLSVRTFGTQYCSIAVLTTVLTRGENSPGFSGVAIIYNVSVHRWKTHPQTPTSTYCWCSSMSKYNNIIIKKILLFIYLWIESDIVW